MLISKQHMLPEVYLHTRFSLYYICAIDPLSHLLSINEILMAGVVSAAALAIWRRSSSRRNGHDAHAFG